MNSLSRLCLLQLVMLPPNARPAGGLACGTVGQVAEARRADSPRGRTGERRGLEVTVKHSNSYRLAQIEETADTPDEEKAFRTPQCITPDLVINGRSLYGEGPHAGTKPIVDVKTLSPCGSYPDERNGNPNAVVNTRQIKVNADYHAKAKSLDAWGGDMRDGFDAELNSYGQAGRVIGPVMGAVAEIPSDVHVIAKAVAEELALEHCRIYGDKTLKVAKGFFLSQIYRSWGLTAYRGWAHLLLDRPCLVQVPNAPGRRSRADKKHYEENLMESCFHPEAGLHASSKS
jgi:hypothetical protein